MAGRSKRVARTKKKASAESSRKRNRGSDEEDTESEIEDSGLETHRKIHVARPSSFQMSVEETDISSIHNGHSVTNTNTADQDRWRMIEERLRCMEERVNEGGGVSVVSAASIAPPANERILKENLRKFVAAKVFPSWKFIFKKDKLGRCVTAAISKSYITLPPGFNENQLADLYSQTVRASLDGCRANAQTTARKRYLSK
jgi:hypothetical protein